MMRIALAAILLVSQHAHAGGCRQVVCNKAVVVQKEVAVAAIVPPVITAVQIQVPLYSYSYSPPVYAPAPVYQQPQQVYQPPAVQQAQQEIRQTVQAIQGDCCLQLIAELRAMRGEIASLRGGGAPIGTPGGPVASTLASNCAKCHTAPNHQGGFAIWDASGKRNPLSIQQKNRARRAILANDMPRPGEGATAHPSLSQEVKDALIRELEGAQPVQLPAPAPVPTPLPAPAPMPQ